MRIADIIKKIDWEKVFIIILAIVGVVFLVFLSHNLFGKSVTQNTQQQTSSNLINTKEIATLSVSEFIYNGIAQTYTENGDHDYNVLYKSTVKVSIEADKINYSVDEEKKIATFILPAFTIENPVIDIGSISTIPNRNDLFMDDIIRVCRSDALAEAKKSDKLIACAQENLQSMIEAWYSPFLEDYSFEYSFITEEGGESK